jgi:YfiH family protein
LNSIEGNIRCLTEGGRYIDFSSGFGEGQIICGMTVKGGAPAWPTLEASLPFNTRVLTPVQIHSSKVHLIRRGEAASVRFPADGLVTDDPGICLTVSVADCLPLYLYDPETPAIGIAHLGWRGIVAGIVENCVETFQRKLGTSAGRIEALLGPCIGRCCYQVTPEVAILFPESCIERREGRIFLDLEAAAGGRLTACGVLENSIFSADECTSCRNELFFSYRAEGDRSGKMIAFIQIGTNQLNVTSQSKQEAG